jgi:hypothetical protein
LTKDQGTNEQPSKRYFNGTTLPEIINGYPIMRRGLSNREIELEMQNRRSFIDFLGGLLKMNPLERWTAQQALQHPFITQKAFTAPFSPLSTRITALKSPDTRTNRSMHEAFASVSKTKKAPLPYESMMGGFETKEKSPNEPKKVNDQYHQMAGTFSDFQIDPQASSLPSHKIEQEPNPPALSLSVTSGNAFPIRKARSQFSDNDTYQPPQLNSFNSTPGLNGSYMKESMQEGHPRHGDFGERIRIPSRMPSAAVSVDWELFRDYDGMSNPGSLASSRQNSFVEMGFNADKRNSLSYSSPGQQRKFPIYKQRIGSVSGEFQDPNSSSFGNSQFGRSSESLNIKSMSMGSNNPMSMGSNNPMSMGSSQGSQMGSPNMRSGNFNKKQRSSSNTIPIEEGVEDRQGGKVAGGAKPIDLPTTRSSRETE